LLAAHDGGVLRREPVLGVALAIERLHDVLVALAGLRARVGVARLVDALSIGAPAGTDMAGHLSSFVGGE
jgi:hypothetical protein